MNYEDRLDLEIIHAVHLIFEGPGKFSAFSRAHMIHRRTVNLDLGFPTLKCVGDSRIGL